MFSTAGDRGDGAAGEQIGCFPWKPAREGAVEGLDAGEGLSLQRGGELSGGSGDLGEFGH
jgi:hypothetical protein